MLVYDAENRVLTATNGGNAGSYSYDGNGHRVKKCLPSCTSPTSTTVYIFSGSKVVGEYDNGATVGSPSREYIYSSGLLLAKLEAGATKYYHQDHLSNRLVTDSSGNVIAQLGHFPFGESWYKTSNDKFLFTTYERDSESGNDYAMARYNVSRLARFSSPDPFPGVLSDPQSFNRYAYAYNDPANMSDPSGLRAGCDQGDASCNGEAIDAASSNLSNRHCLFCGLFGLDEFDLLILGFSPTGVALNPDYWNNLSCLLGDCPKTPMLIYVYGNSWILGFISTDPGDGAKAIGGTLRRLQQLLKQDPECVSFLSSKGIDAQTELSGIIDNNLYGQTTIAPTTGSNGKLTMTNAVSFGYIPGQAITVNEIGAFFNSQYNGMPLTTDRGRIPGGTPAAQGFILLHELGHLTDALKPDAYNQKIIDQNDKTLEAQCSKLIKALSK